MIIYITARLFAWLYGYDWPLTRPMHGGTVNSFLAFWSCFSFPFEVICAVLLWSILRKERK